MTILVLIHSEFRMWTIPDAIVDQLRREFPGHRFLHARDDAEGLQMIGEAEAAFSSQINADQLAAASRLRWIHSPAAGVAGMLYPEMRARDVVVTNSRGMSANTIAEHVVAVTLALFRSLPVAFARQAARTWAQDEVGASPGSRTLAGSRVLIIGLGSIGGATAERMAALGATVSAIRRRAGLGPTPGVSEVRPPEQLLDTLAHADVVVIAAPQTAATRGVIGEREIAAMKADAVLINVSRGGLIDETALVTALRAGRLGGAALDVFRNEPLKPDSPLWDVPNLLITPHVAGFRRDHWQASAALFADNLRRFERGAPLLNVVDKEAGY